MAFTLASRYDGIAFSGAGGPIKFAKVSIYPTGSSTLAATYTDRTKAAGGANPVTADQYGNYSAFLAPGDYDFSVNGYLVTDTVRPDPTEPVVATATFPAVGAVGGPGGPLDAGGKLPAGQIPVGGGDPVDGTAATPSLRTLGTGAQQAAPGDVVASNTTAITSEASTARTAEAARQVRWNMRLVSTAGGGSTYTLAAYDQIEVDCTLGNATVNPPGSPVSGDELDLKKMDASANTVTFVATVDGVVNPTLTYRYQTLTVRYDGAKWVRAHRPVLSSIVDYPATTDARYQQAGTSVQTTGGGKEVVATIDPAGSAATVNLAAGNVFHVLNPAAAGLCTLTLSGATAGVACGCTVFFHQRASGDSTLAFAAAGGTVVGLNDGALTGPTLRSNGVSVYSLETTDGGVTWFVAKAGDSVTAPTVPGAPTGATATAGNAQASVAFTAPASNGGSAISGYTATSTPGGFTASGSASPLVVSGLANGTAYTFTVHATNTAGNSAESAASNSVTPATVPGAPTIGAATPGNASGTVAFTAPGSTGGSAITSYTATASPGGATGTGAASPVTISGLTNGTAYTATVHATNAVGSGAESAASNSFTPTSAPTAPGAPTIGTATFDDTTATANWTAGLTGGSPITGYTVTTYKALDNSLLGTDTTGVVATFTKTGLTNGVGVYFKVAATNAIGTGPQSGASNTVTPQAFTPAIVPNVVDWVEADQIAGPPADGTALASVTPASGALTYTQAIAGKRPIFKASVAAFNNKPVIRFAAASSQELVAAAPAFTGVVNFTMIVVCNATSGATAHALYIVGNGSNGWGIWPASGNSAGKVGALVASMAWQDTTTATPTTTPMIIMYRRTAGTMECWLNGVPATIGGPGVGPSTPTTSTTLGSNVGSAFHDGDLPAAFSASASVSKADLNKLGNYWATKYGIIWTTIT